MEREYSSLSYGKIRAKFLNKDTRCFEDKVKDIVDREKEQLQKLSTNTQQKNGDISE